MKLFRAIPPKLAVLMLTAFMDMVGLLMVLPLLPYYAKRFVGEGPLWRGLDALGDEL